MQSLGKTAQFTPDTSLWRYMKLSTLLLLSRGLTFFPSVRILQITDPLEGTQHYDPSWLFMMLKSLHGPAKLEEVEKWLQREWHPTEIANLNDSGTFGAPYRYEVLAEHFSKEMAARRAVWCWIQNAYESAAMWSIYGNAGVAIETTWDLLPRSLPADREFFISSIRYTPLDTSAVDSISPESPEDRDFLFRPHLVKLQSYSHEKEVRVVARCGPLTKGILIRNIKWKVLVKRIVVSPLYPYEEAEAITEVLRDRFPNVKIERSVLLGEIRDRERETSNISTLIDSLSSGEMKEEGLPSLFANL